MMNYIHTSNANGKPQDLLLEDIALMESQGKPLVFTARLPETKIGDEKYYLQIEDSLRKYSARLSPFVHFSNYCGIHVNDYNLARKMVEDYRKNFLGDLEILEVDRLDMKLQSVA